MKIGIDISQIAYQGTGVAKYTQKLVENLLKIDKKNEYILFFASLRKRLNSYFIKELKNPRVKIKTFKIPPTLLDLLWNRLHICPIEWFIGEVDVFFSSDWLQPPAKRARLVTTIHDLAPWEYPETLPPKIVSVHRRKMKWVIRECDLIICDSQSTKKDAVKILKIAAEKLRVVYPGG